MNEMLNEIEDLLITAGRNDLLNYLKYLQETVDSFDEQSSDSDEEEAEEKYNVGQTEDGFYYLK
tara:strand:+ start:735 stop:926 length:192 start_codon:yes stop_codon:yes gene_type:complete